MRKKYLSALMFGALLLASAGTFTSCKDYDDDIKGLQEQVDKLASKEDMEAKLSQMQTALDAAKATAEKALEAAENAGSTEEIADLQKRIKALEDASIDVEALKKDIQASVDGQLDGFRKEMQDLIDEVEGLVGKLADMVTDVELMYSDLMWPNSILQLSTAIEQNNTFGEGLTNAIKFTEGTQVQTEASFVIKVSPTNAVITPEMVSLVNSKGEKLDDFLNITKVEKFDELLTRAGGNNGLWKVSVALKNYDKDSFESLTKNQDGKLILFAVEVNNTLSTAETREVISAYNLSLNWYKYTPAAQLNYFVDGTNIADIDNRFGLGLNEVKEYTWKNGKPSTAATKDNVVIDGSDNREFDETKCVLGVQGEPITISLSKETETDKVVAPTNIKGLYVTLDKDYAYQSAPSEINAWNSYSYAGLNTVVEGTSTTITVDSKSAINDVIGFRVFAVNYDGTLVDPDGKAFYVKIGAQDQKWADAHTVIVPDAKVSTAANQEKSATQTVSLSKLTGANTLTWTTDELNGNKNAFTAVFVDADGKTIFTTADAASVVGKDFTKVAKVYTVPTNGDWKVYEDNKAYNGTLQIKNADGFVLATMNVSMTKQLPTAVPSGFTFKDKQVINGIYNCYLIADNWAAEQAKTGSMQIENLINFGTGVASQYQVIFAESTVENNKPASITVDGDKALVIDKSYIDYETEHETKVVYNYGQVSSQKNAKGEYEDLVIEAATIKTIYNCFYNKDVHTWEWATKKQLELNDKQELPYSTVLTYGEVGTKAPNAAHIFGTNVIDGEFTSALSSTYGNSLVIKSATLTSDATGKVDYFRVDVTNNNFTFAVLKEGEIGSNPKQDVPSTLTIKCKDSYGHDVVITLPMTVKPR